LQILFKDTKVRLDYLINKVLQDVGEFGKNKEVGLIFKDNFVLEDYEHLEDLSIAQNQKAYKVKLIELLIMLYSFKTPTKIGAVFRAYRMANDLSQQKVSDETGIPLITYQSWERGVRNPMPDGLFKMIRFFKIDDKYIKKVFEGKNKN